MLHKCLEGPHNTYDRSTNIRMHDEAEATAGMGTVARMIRVRAAAKNAFTEPPSTPPPIISFRESRN